MNFRRRCSARTPLMRKALRTLAQAQYLVKHPEMESAMLELKEAGQEYRRSRISRRSFLQLAAQMGLVAGAISQARPLFSQTNRNPAAPAPKLSGDPVVILGAGFAGLTAAYTMMKAGISSAIYEARPDHIGGRVWTVPNFNSDGMFIERGAELVDTNHEDLKNLCQELGIEVQNIIEGDKDIEGAVYFFDGEHYFDKDLLEHFKAIAGKIEKDQKEAFPEDSDDWTPLAKQYDKISVQEYIEKNLPSTEKWLQKMLIQAYTNEFGLPASEQSAVNFLNYIDPDISENQFKLFGDSDESHRIKGGNSQLAKALHEKLIKGGVSVYPGMECSSVTESSDGKFDLKFNQIDGSGKTFKVTANQVICTIPFPVLRNQKILNSLHFSTEKSTAIQEFGYGNNMKLMLGFTERYWRKPLQSKKGKEIPANNANVVTDLKSQQFWETSRAQKGNSGILTNFMGGDWGKNYSKQSFETTKSDLNQLFPGIIETIDYSAKRENWKWPTYKYTMGAYSCPKIGQATTLTEAAGTPEYEGRFLFAGEHTSMEFGGFMNGAIETGKKAAESIVSAKKAAVQKK